MWQKIKDTLNNSIMWLLFLLGCVFFFWKKEQDLENKLEETKASDEIKNAKEEIQQADAAADSSKQSYVELRDEYLSEHTEEKR